MKMQRMLLMVVVAGMLTGALPANAQKGKPAAKPQWSARLEKMLNDGEIPCTTKDKVAYSCALTVDGVTDRFQVVLHPLGEEQKDELVLLHFYFFLGALQEKAPVPAALAKKILEVNSDMLLSKVIKLDDEFWLENTLLFRNTDSTDVAISTVFGFQSAQGLKKELGPYFKQ